MTTLAAEVSRSARPGNAETDAACEGCGLAIRGRDLEMARLSGGTVLTLCPACLEAVRGKE